MDTKQMVGTGLAGLALLAGTYFAGSQIGISPFRKTYTVDDKHPPLNSLKIVGRDEYHGHGFESYAGNTLYFFRDNLGDTVEQLFTDISVKKLSGAAIPGDKRLQMYEWMTKKTSELDTADKTLVRNGYIRSEAVEDFKKALGESFENFDLRQNACLKID